jgi:hypothetical protein
MEASGRGHWRLVDVPLIVAGTLFVIWPLQYRRSIRRIRRRIAARGEDTDRFDRAMERRWIRASLVVAPIAGILCIILGIAT